MPKCALHAVYCKYLCRFINAKVRFGYQKYVAQTFQKAHKNLLGCIMRVKQVLFFKIWGPKAEIVKITYPEGI